MIVNLNKFTYKEIAEEVHKKVIEYNEYSYVTEAQVMNYFAEGNEFRSERFPNGAYDFNDLVSEFIHYLPF